MTTPNNDITMHLLWSLRRQGKVPLWESGRHSGRFFSNGDAARCEDVEMMTGADLQIEVRGQDIIVTMPETSFRVVYRKPNRGSQLVTKLDYFQHDQKGPITRAQFLARAWKLANDKARERGWIV
jgi:hypothetical protein